jgi:VWFA-related protein
MRLAAITLFSTLLTAQDPKFGAQSRLVTVPVSVMDERSQPVTGLEKAAFTLFDNGKPRPVTVDTFDTGVAPVALVVAVQTSGISAPVLDETRKVATMIKPMITGERGCAALLAFAEHVEWKQECTRDEIALQASFSRLRPLEHKNARMLDAVQTAIRKLEGRKNYRRVLLLISESRDRDSETDLQSAVVSAQTAGVAVYAATYSALKTAFTSPSNETGNPPKRPPRPREPAEIPGRDPVPVPPEQRVDIIAAVGELARLSKEKTTELLAERTGGATFSFAQQKGLEKAIQALGEELNSQYVLSFTPEATEPGYHRLEVRVNRPGVEVRARPGYWSAAEAQ